MLRLQRRPAVLSICALRCVVLRRHRDGFPEMAEIARRNAVTVAGPRWDIVIVQGDDASADCRDGSVFWLYSLFARPTPAAIVEHIGQSVFAAPRAVRFCSAFPEFEHVFFRIGWLTRYNTVRPSELFGKLLAQLSLTDACCRRTDVA
jgi:hypothetical protein